MVRISNVVPLIGISAVLVTACREESHAPRSDTEPPAREPAEAELLAPIDLIYVCGNKFLATNATGRPVEVTYRVAGTEDTGRLTLPPASGEDDGGHSEMELTTRERGALELYQNDQRLTRRRNGNVPCGQSARASFSVAALTSADAGSWTAPFSWTVVPLHLSLLPNGKVLAFGHEGEPQLWNPNTGDFTELSLPTELFCAGHTLLADGRLLVAGGHISDNHGLADINIFTPSSQTWTPSTPMQRGRWYPTTTLLANGDVLIMAGADEAGVHVPVPEIWSGGSVRQLTTASLERPYYPRLFLVPNGEVFYVGELKTTRYLNTAGSGTWRYGSDRLYGSRDYGAAVMYDAGKILYVGGGRTTNTAETIDLTSSAPAWKWTGSMAYPRRHLNATVLPTGEVLVTGGSSGTGFNDVALGVHPAEIWNPTTGIWTVLAANAVNRTYHGASLLLPDGRVLHAGSGDAFGTPPERNAELFSPPYLFRGARPTISAAPTSIPYNSTFQVTTPEAAEISKVSFIRLGSTTHAFDMNQRFQWLQFQRGTGELTITGPANPNITPPGHYMLFIMNGTGVPSVAKIIRVGGAATEPTPNSAPTAAFSQTCSNLSCSFSDGSTDTDGTVTGWSWTFGDGATATTRNPSHTYANGGTFTVTLVAKDDDGATGSASKAMTVTTAATNAAPTASFVASCAALICSFSDRSTDSDGSVASWRWTFGDGTTSTLRNPSRTYAGSGTYTVTLQVTDDDGATNQRSSGVTLTSAIQLSVTGRMDGNRKYETLSWTGAPGNRIDIFMNGQFLRHDQNDGSYTASQPLPGLSKYTFKVCKLGSTTICSSEASVSF